MRLGASGMAAAIALLCIVVTCAAAPLYAAYVSQTDPFVSAINGAVQRGGGMEAVLAQNTAGLGLGATPIGPGWSGQYLLGADGQGRDVAARLLYGGRISLLIAGAATTLTLVVAAAIGIVAGLARGWVDAVLRFGLDMVWAFPVLLLAISLSAALATAGLRIGPVQITADSLVLPIVILGVVFVPYVARPVRAQVLALRETDFVAAAVLLGGSPLHVAWRHIVPHVGRMLVLFAPAVAAFDLLTEASLSVLGVGVQAPGASWGTLIADGQSLLYTRAAVAVAPGVAVIVTAVALNILADALRAGQPP